ncbi:MAG: secondary thiamine-phosphate synthase enzyme YjbQ [Acidobacteriota bacterium]
MIKELQIRTPSHACFVDITSEVGRFVGQSGVNEGICCLYVPHTTAGLTINENADPTVQSDILRQLDKFVPWDDHYAHSEGNAAAHIKSSLLGSSLMILIESGRLRLGAWQGIFLAEFDGPRTRQVWVKALAG